ncbi:hypothetical protein Tsubulata_032788 [Turnera subulata]|uniref:pectinesterase n=1 Tax=Turnera subulata TaxID=218843 RepID=A0A9Q0JFW1_9ROSI|nr:hypothetical protein Tsubulata_032788 [Turnera subulata]
MEPTPRTKTQETKALASQSYKNIKMCNTIAFHCVIMATILVSITADPIDTTPIPTQDGSGNFKTLTEAIANIPTGNSQRIIVDIGPGKYVEKLTIDASKPFVTFYGAPDKMPTLSYNGDAQKFGTARSASGCREGLGGQSLVL